MTGPNHHYVPKLYLKWFESDGGPAKSVYHLDKRLGTIAKKSVKKIGMEANFNTVDLEEVGPGYFEQRYDTDFERPAAPVLYNIWKNRVLPTRGSKDFNLLLSFVALLYVRNPSVRAPFVETLRSVQAKRDSLERQLAFERHHGTRRRPVPSFCGPSIPREALDRNRTAQVQREFRAVRSIQSVLFERDWKLITISEGDQLFVTSDRPVTVAPVPPYPDHLPVGIGMRQSRVFLPLNSRCLLVGGLEAEVLFDCFGVDEVRIQNSLTFITSRRSVFSPHPDFDVVYDTVVVVSSLLSKQRS